MTAGPLMHVLTIYSIGSMRLLQLLLRLIDLFQTTIRLALIFSLVHAGHQNKMIRAIKPNLKGNLYGNCVGYL